VTHNNGHCQRFFSGFFFAESGEPVIFNGPFPVVQRTGLPPMTRVDSTLSRVNPRKDFLAVPLATVVCMSWIMVFAVSGVMAVL
jgi:hypothetical protein